jgi:uncharacterized membrane protein YhaH (DUF805 family)
MKTSNLTSMLFECFTKTVVWVRRHHCSQFSSVVSFSCGIKLCGSHNKKEFVLLSYTIMLTTSQIIAVQLVPPGAPLVTDEPVQQFQAMISMNEMDC